MTLIVGLKLIVRNACKFTIAKSYPFNYVVKFNTYGQGVPKILNSVFVH